MVELGVAGAFTPTGMNEDSFIPDLRGYRAIRKYREMRDNDPIIGAILLAMDMMIRGVDWKVHPAEVAGGDEAAEFIESVLGDMSHSFDEHISEALSMLAFGFSFFETVFKRRDGPDQRDASRRSRYNDGLIGIRKLAPRAQWTIDRFMLDDKGGVKGIVQNASTQMQPVEIPIEKGLLYRTVSSNNAPSGRSLLRNAYTSYYYASHIETIESISIERELNGLPLGRIPAEFLAPNATEAQRAFVSEFKKILRDVKNNEQGFVLIPSDLYENEDGSKTNKHLVEFELVASNGSRDIDPSKVIIRHQQNMARTVLADFIMLGQNDRGSFALSKSKTDLFLRSMQGYLNNIAGVINKHLFPRLWMMNGFDLATMPSIQPGRVAPVDLEELGTFIQRVANAGAPLFPDEDLDNALRDAAGLPEAEHGEDMALAVSGEDTDDDDQES